MTRASIIIVTHGQRPLTERCLESLQASLGDRLGREYELVLVDNASSDDTPELLRGWRDRAQVLLLERNLDFAGGCNAGATVAAGEVLVFLNSDTEVGPGTIEALVEQALEPGVAVAGARLLFPDGTIQHAGVAFVDHPDAGMPMPQHVLRGCDGDLAAARASYELDCVTGACMAVRAVAFRVAGGFNDGFRNGMEDVDLCLRIRMQGDRIVYRGDISVIHHEGGSRGRGTQLYSTTERLRAMEHNDRRLMARWGAVLEQDDELAARVWDARLEFEAPRREEAGAELLVAGHASGIGPGAEEARALLSALAELGFEVAACDPLGPLVGARLGGPLASLLERAQRHATEGCRAAIHVPAGATDHWPLGRRPIVRLGIPRTRLALPADAEVWASSPAVVRALGAAGLDPRRVRLVPPPIVGVAAGPGGAGLLVILPAHDPPAARQILDAVRPLQRSAAVRLLPTVHSRCLEAEVDERLPGAQLLAPCSDEQRFAVLAAEADVVLAADATDLHDRRALVAAATGAAVLTLRPGGAAAWLLGGAAACAVEDLGGALATTLAAPGERSPRAGHVSAACSPAALARHLPADERPLAA